MMILKTVLSWLRLNRTAAIVVAACAALAATAGYFARRLPSREVTTREQVADVELRQEVTATVTRATVRRETRTETRPDGGQVVTVIDERTDAASRADATAAGEARVVERERVVVERVRPSWRLETRAGWHRSELGQLFQERPPILGAGLSRRIAGPVWVGAWAQRDRDETTAGVSLAVEW